MSEILVAAKKTLKDPLGQQHNESVKK